MGTPPGRVKTSVWGGQGSVLVGSRPTGGPLLGTTALPSE